MIIRKINSSNIKIIPENREEQEYLEKELGWNTKESSLLEVFCNLTGYKVEEREEENESR